MLVGDDRQLPEIQAGGAFRALADTLGAVELREVRRQHEAWDRGALDALRRGDVEAGPPPTRARAARHRPERRRGPGGHGRDWCDAHAGGDTAVMIAHRR